MTLMAAKRNYKKMLKMTKKVKKDLQDPKKSSIFAPEIAEGKSQVVFEKCSKTPCKEWKPKEAMTIREMLVRTERGQRLDVHTRFRAEGIPDNMYFAEYEDVQLPDGSIEKRVKHDFMEDTFEHTPPDDVADIVDVIRLQEETNARKEELTRKRKQQTVANAPKADPKPASEQTKEEGPRADLTKEA